MNTREYMAELAGSICFLALLYLLTLGLYVMAPYQPPMHGETTFAERH